ncbi:MAG: AMP-binding protein [Clostridia bacterium]|nr:AMP-binding protein [Clostridia bacterium]
MKNQAYPLYDIPKLDTLKEVIAHIADKYEDEQAFRIPRKGKQGDKYKTFREFSDEIKNFGTILLEKGFKDDKIAIIGENSYKWIVSYFAVTNTGNVALPLDRELSYKELADLVNRCGCKGVIFSKSFADYADYFKENCPSVEIYIGMKEIHTLKEDGAKLIAEGNTSFDDVKVSPDDLAAIVFTSGTTGKSKGVMLTHGNIASDTYCVCKYVTGEGRGPLLLPLHHTFSITANVLAALMYGGRIHAITSLRNIQRDMVTDKTTTMIAVPTAVEMIHKKVWATAEEKGKAEIMKKGIKISNFLLKFGIDVRKKLFKEVYEGLGGEFDLVICGGAALSQKAEEDMSAWGINVVVGYGITECAPIVSVNRPHHQKRGSSGLVIECNQVRIENKDENGIGEIQVKGANVFKGYYDDEEETKNSFTEDGWFKTGDLGYLDEDGFLFITGRIKNLIILSNGKNVSPEELEGKIIDEIPSIVEAVVFEKNDSIAIEMFLDTENYPDAKAEIQEQVNAFNRQMPAYKKIQEVIIRDEEFPKTTTLKIKRRYDNK